MHKFGLKHFAAAAVFGLSAASASAVVVTVTPPGTAVANQGLVSSVGGLACKNISFNESTNLQTFADPSSQCSGVSYNFSAGNPYVSGDSQGKYAKPPGDDSVYLSVGPSGTPNSGASPVTINLPNVNYFGFYAASLDWYNYVEFFKGRDSVGSFSGTTLAELAGVNASGNQSAGFYFNVYLSNDVSYFDSVVLTSANYAFETDNHSFGIATAPETVPVPGVLALLSIGLVGIGATRRKQA